MKLTKPVQHTTSIVETTSSHAELKRKTPFTHDRIDTREETAPHFKPNRDLDEVMPQLPKPDDYKPSNYSTSLVRMLDSILNIGELQKETASSVIKVIEDSIGITYRKAVENAISEDKYTEASGWCDYFRKAAICILAAFSIVVGGNILQNSPLTGVALIGSGVTSLFGNLLIDANAQPGAAAVLTVLSAGFGLIAGIGFNPDAMADVASQIAMAGLAIVASSAELGQHISHYMIEDIKAMQAMLEELMNRCHSIVEEQGNQHLSTNHMIVSSFGKASESAQAMEQAKRGIIANMLAATAV